MMLKTSPPRHGPRDPTPPSYALATKNASPIPRFSKSTTGRRFDPACAGGRLGLCCRASIRRFRWRNQVVDVLLEGSAVAGEPVSQAGQFHEARPEVLFALAV